ncbi:ABC-2 type transporter-domain-containing protein [Achaetomium macrosporum]|uniref:ABC-2 type transporter-domain-containing protein n=1 Tax=Achaetomium macrosporum TaxID=79813 RepID=A0AAN7HHX8_9PEZI|nr:ABC-2 type transporter-domain-containing protein [Achaetomium macrosporum]
MLTTRDAVNLDWGLTLEKKTAPESDQQAAHMPPAGDPGNAGSGVTAAERPERDGIAVLARQSSRASAVSAVNPFLSREPALDPESPLFDPRRWVEALLHAFSQDPARYPRHHVGVAYRDLGVFGFGGATERQRDVLNVLWRGPRMLLERISARRTKVQILRGLDGLVREGEMLLVLGRPGSGVTTLLKTIAGQTRGLHLDKRSLFNYKGIPRDVMLERFRGEVIYQAETDVHFPQLTVGETLLVAAVARTPKNRLPGVSRRLYAEHLRDVVMAMFGISHTVNTRLGNDFIRGVSGGERKRVSIAEAMLNRSAIQCWDNATRGLDSATALEFARILRLSTDLGRTAAIVAMYQASQPAYKDDAKAYFTGLGYHCPDRQTTADFLTSVTSPAERVVRPGFERRVPRTPDEFAEAWRRSEARARLLREMDAFEREFPLGSEDQVEKLHSARKAQQTSLARRSGSCYTTSVPTQVGLCVMRGLQKLRGDKTFFVATVGSNLVISLVLGSVFYNLPATAESMISRCTVLFFAVLFNALSSSLEILALFGQRPIVEKHARYALCRPVSEAVASILCDLPCKVLCGGNLGILIAYIVFFAVAYLLAAELVSSERSKGEVLVFRGRRGGSVRPAATQDEEAGGAKLAERTPAESDTSEDAKPVGPPIRRQEGVLHWRNLCYDVPVKGSLRRILDHVDGWVKPGTLTALMGATGAGKTTLLDVLANRVAVDVVTGDVLVNGHPRTRSFQRQTGYVQQQDLHLETSTVREALRFSALLRQPAATPMAEKYAYVEKIIKLLEMEAFADAVIGVPGEGLNVEQRKRLTIGVELAAKPSLLLFLDEPTSGLDSQTAWSIATLIRKLSDNGQAVLCTIYQPSALLFQQFDRLLLLSKGGKTVYFGDIGPNSRTLTSYFERHGAVPCGDDENPAEWMLKVIGAAPGADTDQDWFDVWRHSAEYASLREEFARLERGSSPADGPEDQSVGASQPAYSAPFHTQLVECTRRAFQQYWRTRSYIYAKLILCGGTSLFIGLSFYRMPLSLQGLQNQMFSIFLLMVIFAFLVYQAMPHFIAQRTLYEARERASKTYAWFVFLLANQLVELPWAVLASLFVFAPFYYLVGMDKNAVLTDAVAGRGATMWLLSLLFMLYQSTFAGMMVAAAPTAEVGATFALLLFAMSLIFCGVMSPPSALPGFWIFMYRVSPFTYLIGALLAVGIAHTTVTCSPLERLTFHPAAGTTCGEYMGPFLQMAGGEVYNPAATESCEFCALAGTDAFLTSVGVEYGQRWRNYGIVWVYVLVNVLGVIGLYWLARGPKGEVWRAVAQKIVGTVKRHEE